MVLSGRANVTVPSPAWDHIPFTPTVLSSPSFPKPPDLQISSSTLSHPQRNLTCSDFCPSSEVFWQLAFPQVLESEQPIIASNWPAAKQQSKFPPGKQQYENVEGKAAENVNESKCRLRCCLHALHGHDMMGNVRLRWFK